MCIVVELLGICLAPLRLRVAFAFHDETEDDGVEIRGLLSGCGNMTSNRISNAQRTS